MKRQVARPTHKQHLLKDLKTLNIHGANLSPPLTSHYALQKWDLEEYKITNIKTGGIKPTVSSSTFSQILVACLE